VLLSSVCCLHCSLPETRCAKSMLPALMPWLDAFLAPVCQIPLEGFFFFFFFLFFSNSLQFYCAKPQFQPPHTLLFWSGGEDSQDAFSFSNLLHIAAADLGTYLICDLRAPVKHAVTPSRLILSITKFSFLLSSAETSFPLLQEA